MKNEDITFVITTFKSEKIIKLNSDDNNEKKLIENLKFKINDVEEKKITASSLLEDIKHDPNNVDLHIQLVNKYVNVRNFDSAIKHIEEYLKISISELSLIHI